MHQGFPPKPSFLKAAIQYVRRNVPVGGALPEDIWQRRHRFLVILTWVHVVIISLIGPIFGYSWEFSVSAFFRDDSVLHTFAESLVVALFAGLASWRGASRAFRATAVSFGLMSASAIFVHLSGGYIEFHFHFFVMLVFLALYQDWVPYLFAVGYVALHHGVVGVLWPAQVYNHSAAINAPWTWAGIHAFFVLCSCVGSIIAWRFNEKSRAQSQLILDSAGEGIFGLNSEGAVTFINPSAAGMLRLDVTDAVGRPLDRIMRNTVASGSPILCLWSSIMASLTDRLPRQQMNEIIERVDGSDFAADYHVTPMIERDELVGLVVTFRDATERNRTEQALRSSEEKFRALAGTATDAIVSADSLGNIVYFNEAAEQIFGYSSSEVAGKSLTLLMPERFRQPHRDGLLRYLSSREPKVLGKTVELAGWTKGGVEFPLEVSIAAWKAREATFFTAIMRDITDRKTAEREIQNNLRRIQALHEIDLAITSTLDLRRILDVLLEKIELFFDYSTACTVRLLDPRTAVLEPAACRNIDEAEWKAQVWSATNDLFKSIFETGAPIIARNVQLDPLLVDHHEFFIKNQLVSYLGIPLRAKSRSLGLLGLFTRQPHVFTPQEVDFLTTLAGQAAVAIQNSQLLEETKQQTYALEKSNKVKDEFLSVTSHELRTPLITITGYARLLEDESLGALQPEQVKAARVIKNQANDLLTMIRHILETTRLEAGTMTVERETLEIREMLDGLADFYSPAREKEVTVRWDCAGDLPRILTDGIKLKQILQNLVDNALKFTERGQVTVSARMLDEGRTTEFKVADTGVGIPGEMGPLIFDKFRQVDGSDARGHEGIGLGLYIVKQFTDLIGGSIDFESEVGKGTVFTLRVPDQSHWQNEQEYKSQTSAQEKRPVPLASN
jgi:PAS domain S-box-containing protein